MAPFDELGATAEGAGAFYGGLCPFCFLFSMRSPPSGSVFEKARMLSRFIPVKSGLRRSGRRRFVLIALSILSFPVAAELESIEVGGEIAIRSRNFFNYFRPTDRTETPYPYVTPARRALGPLGLQSRYDFCEGRDKCYTELYTLLEIEAAFSRGVRSVMTFDASQRFGEGFRSDPWTGADQRGAGSAGDLEFLEAYLELSDLFEAPLRLRVGRQRLRFGKGWLVGDRFSVSNNLSFDAVRLSYTPDAWTLDCWAAKLAEGHRSFLEEDVDFYGLYAVYGGLETLSIAGYWFWVRDHESIAEHTQRGVAGEAIEAFFDMDCYGHSNLHTLGLRLEGEVGRFSVDLEGAWQCGEANALGEGFVLYTGAPGVNDAEYHHWAGDLEVRYRLDAPWQPKLYVGGAWFEGEDRRNLSFWEWLNPFQSPEASVSFNRLFSTVNYSPMREGPVNYSNIWQVRAGLRCTPTERLSAQLEAYKLGVVDPFELPRSFRLGGVRLALAPPLSFLTEASSADLGWGLLARFTYAYSDNLTFKLVYEHLFTGPGFYDGNYVRGNGLELVSGLDDADVDYYYLLASLKF